MQLEKMFHTKTYNYLTIMLRNRAKQYAANEAIQVDLMCFIFQPMDTKQSLVVEKRLLFAMKKSYATFHHR